VNTFPPRYVPKKVLTIAETIAYLQQFPQDAKLVVTWEGTHHGLFAGEFFPAENILEFDVEHEDWYGYK